MILTDESPMPFGKFEGKRMEDVPGSYLLWLYEEDKCNSEVKEYIEDNMDAIKLEIKNENNTQENINILL